MLHLLKTWLLTQNVHKNILIRIILDKKYALPYRVVDAVVFHFLGFRSEKRQLPVLWHQVNIDSGSGDILNTSFKAMLTFCQRYKQDVSSEQKTALLEICKVALEKILSRRKHIMMINFNRFCF